MKLWLLIGSICLLLLVVTAWWMMVPGFYRLHKSMKEDHPLIFRLVGCNEKYLGDEEKWVRHGRVYVIVMGALMGVVLASIILPFITM